MYNSVAHVALMTLIFQAIARMPALGLSFPQFFASGLSALRLLSAHVRLHGRYCEGQQGALLLPIVTPFDEIVSHFILQLITDTLVAILILMTISNSAGSLSR